MPVAAPRASPGRATAMARTMSRSISPGGGEDGDADDVEDGEDRRDGAPEPPLVEVPGLEHEDEGRSVDAGGHRQGARQRPARDVETRSGVAQVEAPRDDGHGDQHGDADHDPQPAIIGAEEHEQPDRQADRGPGDHPSGDSAIGVVTSGDRLVAVGERGQPEGHDDGVVRIEDDRQEGHGGQAETEAGRQLDGARDGDDERHADERGGGHWTGPSVRRDAVAPVTRCRCSAASYRREGAVPAPTRAGR